MSSNGKVKTLAGKEFMVARVMAQCLIAANHTVEAPHHAHSFHSYFLRPGIMEESILFDVDRIRNGKVLRREELELSKMARQYLHVQFLSKKKKKDLSIKLI